MTPEIWVEVDDRRQLDDIRSLGVASAFITSNPRLYGRPGDRIYLTPEALRSGWGNRDPRRFGAITTQSAPMPTRAQRLVVIASDPSGVQADVDMVLVPDLESIAPSAHRLGIRVASSVEADEAAAAGASVLVVGPELVGEVRLRSEGGTVDSVLDRAAEHFGNHAAIVDHASGVTVDYRRLRHRARRLAHGLLTRVDPHATVGIATRNLPQWPEAFFAAAYAGVTLVHLNPALRGEELHYILSKAKVSLLLAEPGVEEAIAIARGLVLPTLGSVIDVTGPEYRSLFGPAPRHDLPGSAPSDVAAIQFTSGTTGLPKGAMLTHHGITANAAASAGRLDLGGQDRICVPLPLFHCFGSVVGLLAAATTGAAVILPSAWFNPERTLDAVRRQHATVIYGVPTMYVSMLERVTPKTRPRSLRTGLVGGAPVDADLMKRIADELGVTDIGQIYGLTEASPAVTMTSPTDPAAVRFGTVGRPVAGVRVRVTDEQGREVPSGEPGEVWSRSDMNMAGYLDDPEATAAALSDGWLRTGDMATVDTEGNVRIVGRSKEMIIRGGENIYPAEIESVLNQHPAVRLSAVAGEPSALYGEEVIAFVEAASPIDPSDLLEHCREHLAPYKVPKEIRLVDELARTSSGKVIKSGLVTNRSHPTAPPAQPERLRLPLLDLTLDEPQTDVRLLTPQSAIPAVMERSSGWRSRHGPGWRPRQRVLAPIGVGAAETETIEGPRPGWVRPGRPRWN